MSMSLVHALRAGLNKPVSRTHSCHLLTQGTAVIALELTRPDPSTSPQELAAIAKEYVGEWQLILGGRSADELMEDQDCTGSVSEN